MAAAYTFTAALDTTTVDLTDPAVNPHAAPESTPRQGGFTLRNRWDCSDDWSPATFTSSDIAATKSTNAVVYTVTPFFVLDVPARTMVNDLSVFAVAGETGPSHIHTYSGTAADATASDLKSQALAFYAVPWKKNDGTSAATPVAGLGAIPLGPSTASLPGGEITGSQLSASFNASSDSKISVPTQAGMKLGEALTLASGKIDAGTFNNPMYFPHGGRVSMRLEVGDGSISSGTSGASAILRAISGAMSGVWDIQANCNYVPE
jgi:hypothetical protein